MGSILKRWGKDGNSKTQVDLKFKSKKMGKKMYDSPSQQKSAIHYILLFYIFFLL